MTVSGVETRALWFANDAVTVTVHVRPITGLPGENRHGYPSIEGAAHALIGEAFSRAVITPDVTTAEQVQWWYRDRLLQLGLDPWFHPSVAIQRRGAKGMLEGAEVIRPGDLLWIDFGITYLRLNADTQHLAYGCGAVRPMRLLASGRG